MMTVLRKMAEHPVKALTKILHLVQDLPVLVIGQRPL
jgi:hypothetical protein